MTMALGNGIATRESNPNPCAREALGAGRGCTVSGCGMHGPGSIPPAEIFL